MNAAATINAARSSPTTYSADAEKLHSRISCYLHFIEIRRTHPGKGLMSHDLAVGTGISCQERPGSRRRTACASATRGHRRRLRAGAAEWCAEPRIRGTFGDEVRRIPERAGSANLGVRNGTKL